MFTLIILSITLTYSINSSGVTKIFAITPENEGLVAELNLYTIPGRGDVAFITSNSLVGKDTQTTGNIALQVAEKKSEISRSNLNYIFDIKANASEVDGPSAGAAMTLLAYSLLSERPLSNEVGITGTIRSDGSIGSVGGVGYKAKAAAENGIKLLMIPQGTANAQVKINNEIKTVNLLSYGPEELKIKIVEVVTIDDVINYAYSKIEEIKVDTNAIQFTFVPTPITYKKSLEPMHEISLNYIKQATLIVEETKKELETTTLDDEYRESFYAQIGVVERNIEMSKIYLDQNYLYSAANYSFNARVLASAIKEVSKNPTLLLPESNILNSKISSLKKDIEIVKNESNFISITKYEWIIGAQQRIAYAENALNKIQNDAASYKEEGLDEEGAQFRKVYDYVSAQAWIDAAKDFINEAKKSNDKKEPQYSTEILEKINQKMIEVKSIIIDTNVSKETLDESKRRYNSALISIDNNFFFAALYDIYFAESYILGEKERQNKDLNELEIKISELLEKNSSNSSIWANLFYDHSKFYIENAKYEESMLREESKRSNLDSSFDLLIISSNIEKGKLIVEDYIASTKFNNYNSINDVGIEITYTKKETLAIYLYAIAGLLALALIFLIYVGFKSSKPRKDRFSRAEKVNLVLNRLDKALSKKKISDAEYFFMKKNYEKEFKDLTNKKTTREKIILNLDESRTKLRALEKGINDLDRHYKSGLIIPEDYERQSNEVKNEILEIRTNIKEYLHALREERTLRAHPSKKNSENILKKIRKIILGEEEKIKGTEDLAKEQEKEEKKERKQRRKLIQERKIGKWGNN
ncbi:MAG TPA: hypothetical protein PKK60_03730 [archaeon]|nr:hypothetical protein [archaeon]